MINGYRRSADARKEYFRKYRQENIDALKQKARARYLRNRTEILKKIASKRPALHGLTTYQYNEMLTAQNNSCAICEKEFTRTPNIDHDHECCEKKYSCGKCVRGLLCYRCNQTVALGTKILSRAVEYINNNQQTTDKELKKRAA